MKNYEKKSLFTTTFLFFIPLIIFASIVLFMYYNDKIKDIEQNLLYQMKDYTFDFQDDTFSLDIVQVDKEKQTFKIYHSKEGLYAYFKMPSSSLYLLKVIYTKEQYQSLHQSFLLQIFKYATIAFVLLFFISIAFAFYSLKPMKEALNLLETFLKDLIHDLNTPATSILLNAKLLKKRGDFEEVQRIELSAKTIASLYKNLEFINSNSVSRDELVSLNELVNEKIKILNKLYPKVALINKMQKLDVLSNKKGLERIIDNLLTNACKYNKKNGFVYITTDGQTLSIEDTGIGIKDLNKVFQRYYKENDNGLGIGMSIVKNLCDMLNIDIKIQSEVDKGTLITLNFL